MQTFTCQKWGKWNFGSKPTNPPTHPTSITSNSIVTRCCCGLGVLATVKHWRHHDLSSVIRPRNRGHLHLNLRTQRCWRRLRLAWWLPGGGLTASSCFFFGGGGVEVELKTKSVLGFFGWGFFSFSCFLSFWCGWRISKFISIVLACTQKFMNETNWIEIQKNKSDQNWGKNCPTKRALCAPNLSRDLPPTREQRRQGLAGPPQTRVASRPKLDPKILFKTDVSLMWFVMFVPTYRWNLAGDDSWGGMKIDRKDLQAIVAWSHVWT